VGVQNLGSAALTLLMDFLHILLPHIRVMRK